MTKRTILLNPGPVTLTQRVRHALLEEDMCHREPDFATLVLDTKARLLDVYAGTKDNYDAVLVTGSGTCGVEAMLATLVPKDGKALVIANGVYGERMADMVKAHGKPLQLIKSDWAEPIDLAPVEAALESGGISHVITVHNETTTGRLNDLDALGALCKRYDTPLLLDAVSSFGAERIEFEKWNIMAAAATANKCLHGVPGVSFVIARRDALEQSSHAPSLYLDLCRYYQAQKKGFSPFTPAVHASFALLEALKEFSEAGGWQARNLRYREVAERIRSGLSQRGVKLFLDSEQFSSMISSFYLPEGYDYSKLHDKCRNAGFVIYAGQGGLELSIFRIANMGDISDEDVERLLDVFSAIAKEQTG